MGRPRKNNGLEHETEGPELPGPDILTPRESGRDGWSDIKHYRPVDFKCKCEGLCNHEDQMATEVVRMLDTVRESMEVPLRVLKGIRCHRANEAAGGDPNSGHIPNGAGVAHAVDVLCPDARQRFSILTNALQVGFNRIGLGKNWVHLEFQPGGEAKCWNYRETKRSR